MDENDPNFNIEFLSRLYMGMKSGSQRGEKGSPGDGSVPMMVAVKNAKTEEGPGGWGFVVIEGIETHHLKDALTTIRAEAFDNEPCTTVGVLADAYYAKGTTEDELGLTEDGRWAKGKSPEERFKAGDMSIVECLQIMVLHADGSTFSRSILYHLGDDGMILYEDPQDSTEPTEGLVPDALKVLVAP